MPKVTEAHIEARRQQILDAAAECFARKGFHHSTMHDICQMAELSPGAVYRYFASKDDIIAAMEEQGRQHSAAIIEAVTCERKDTLDVLEGLVDVFFSKLEDVRDCAVHIELWAEALSNPRIKEMVVGIDDSIRDAFVTRIVHDAQKRGEINAKLDADSVARVMMAFWDGLVLQKTLDPEVDIWKYVAVMKSMMGGTFWQKREAGRS
jgi:TetR/AcrR family transcriptional regulator, repressor for uid operon